MHLPGCDAKRRARGMLVDRNAAAARRFQQARKGRGSKEGRAGAVRKNKSRPRENKRLRDRILVRLEGIEPSTPAWKAEVLPLNYSREQTSAFVMDGMGQAFALAIGGGKRI